VEVTELVRDYVPSMPWIEQIAEDQATGQLKQEYDKAIARAGRLWHIVQIMGLNPKTLETSIGLYIAIMYGRSPLSRRQRELLATVVSAELDCFYGIQAHAHDLRAEVDDDHYVHAVVRDWRSAPLDPEDHGLCEFAAKLTHEQRKMTAADVERLRSLGFNDRAIHDATQVIAYFNYITRIADGLGVEPEDFIQPWGAE
jgi:uncharacterized peroxidase-related enzyme